MAISLSTGAKINILKSGFPTTFDDSLLLLFSGSPPVNPDDAVSDTSVLVARAAVDQAQWTVGTKGAFGIDWDDPDEDGVITALDIANIEAVGVAEGTARWFWLIENNGDVAGDTTNILSTSLLTSKIIARMQGLVAVGGGDLSISNNAFTVGSTSNADNFRVYFPPN